MQQVAILEPSERFSGCLAESLAAEGYRICIAPTEATLLSLIERGQASLIILGALVPASDPRPLLQHIRELTRAPIVFLPEASSEALAIDALRLGVNQYLPPPASVDQVRDAVLRLLRTTNPAAAPVEDMVGESPAILRLKSALPRLGQSHCSVLIIGETGTGKELVAEAIHRLSPRRDQPLLAVNCAAVPDSLLESELFGYERGAFTGAAARTDGLLHAAHRGTLFLDEIGDMSLVAQAKILRAMETRRVQRLGSREPVQVDVRFVTATHHDLDRRIQEGGFRPDLYFRINVASIDLPPLRERVEDIPLLVRHFLDIFGASGITLSDSAVALLAGYRWPGNIRELRNVVQAALVYLTKSVIGVEDLPASFLSRAGQPVRASTHEWSAQVERSRVLAALQETRWNKSRAAEALHWSRMTLYRKMAKHRIAPRQAQDETSSSNTIKHRAAGA